MQKISLFLIVCIFVLTHASGALSDTLNNSNYQLDLQHFTIKGGITDLTIAPSPASLSPHSQENRELGQPLHFSVAQEALDFGMLTPSNPVVRTLDLSLDHGYSLFAFENNELSSITKDIIPDTSCDDGTCSSIHASIWQSPLSFGFGYHCLHREHPVCNASFTGVDTYERTANARRNEDPSQIAGSIDTTGIDTIQLLYKLNVSAVQIKQMYTNTISLLALPRL